MLNLRALAAIVVLPILPIIAKADDPIPAAAQSASSTDFTIGVADFTGGDADRGRFLAETLLTDMSQSGKLQLVERNEIKHALDELKLQSTGLFDPGQVKELGKLVRADHLIVGSYLENGDQLIINARLLDVETGRVAPGGGANVVGPRKDLLGLIHRLAHLLHRRITGEDFLLDGESPQPLQALDELLPHPKLASDRSRSSQAAPQDQSQESDAEKPLRKVYPGKKPANSNAGYRFNESEDGSGWYTPSSSTPSPPAASVPQSALTESDIQQALNSIYAPNYYYSYSYTDVESPSAFSFGLPYGNYGSNWNYGSRRYNNGYNYNSTYINRRGYPQSGLGPPIPIRVPGSTYTPPPGSIVTPPPGSIYTPPPGSPYIPPQRPIRPFNDDKH